jgi:hypothetical protein
MQTRTLPSVTVRKVLISFTFSSLLAILSKKPIASVTIRTCACGDEGAPRMQDISGRKQTPNNLSRVPKQALPPPPPLQEERAGCAPSSAGHGAW